MFKPKQLKKKNITIKKNVSSSSSESNDEENNLKLNRKKISNRISTKKKLSSLLVSSSSKSKSADKNNESTLTSPSFLDTKTNQGNNNKRPRRLPQTKNIFSFDDHHEDEDDDSEVLLQARSKKTKQKKSKKKKRVGLGYGGGNIAINDDNDKDTSMNDDDNNDATNIITEEKKDSYYGKEELEQLKYEQKIRKFDTTSTVEEPTATAEEEEEEEELDFISIHPNTTSHNVDNAIYAGDDAISMINTTKTKKIVSEDNNKKWNSTIILDDDSVLLDVSNKNNTEIDDTEEEAWEEQILKRTAVPSIICSENKSSIKHDEVPSLQQPKQQKQTTLPKTTPNTLKSIIKSSITQLKQKKTQLNYTVQRTQIEISTIQHSISSSEKELKTNQTQFDFYTSLRYDTAKYLSVLREFYPKVQLVYESYLEFYGDYKAIIFDHWKKVLLQDIITASEEEGNDEDDHVIVDEFGRNVIPSEKLDQIKRISIWKESLDDNNDGSSTDLDNDITRNLELTLSMLGDDNKIPSSSSSSTTTTSTEMKEKRFALIQAISTLFQTVSYDESTSSPSFVVQSWMEQLMSLSKKFKINSKQEYEQIYASASFAELMSICFKVVCCQQLDFLGLLLLKEEKSIECIQDIPYLQQHNLEDKMMQSMILKKTIVPIIQSMIENGYNPISTNQSHSMSRFISSMIPFIEDEKLLTSRLLSSLLVCFKDTFSLRFLNLPIEFTSLPTKESIMEQQQQDRIDYIRIMYLVQIYKCKVFLMNICHYWENIFHKYNADLHIDLGRFVIHTVFLQIYVPMLTKTASSWLQKENIQKELQVLIKCFILDTNWLKISNSECWRYIMIDWKHVWDQYGVTTTVCYDGDEVRG